MVSQAGSEVQQFPAGLQPPEGRDGVARGVNPWRQSARRGRSIAGGVLGAMASPPCRHCPPGVDTPGYAMPPLTGLRTARPHSTETTSTLSLPITRVTGSSGASVWVSFQLWSLILT